MRSVPSHRTARKQKGKSSAVSAKYTPSADQPYSLDSFFRRCDNDGAGSGLPKCGVGFGRCDGGTSLLKRSERNGRERDARSERNKKGRIRWRELGRICGLPVGWDAVKKVRNAGAEVRVVELLERTPLERPAHRRVECIAPESVRLVARSRSTCT